MSFARLLFFFLIIVCSIFETYPASAQAKVDPDELLKQSKTAAFDNKDYPKAIALCREALRISPQYTDIVVFLGRLYTWNKQPDSARIYFERALQQKGVSEDGYIAYSDMEYYQLVFMDVMMPDMDGYEATSAIIREKGSGRPVIIATTANALAGDKEKTIEAGMDDYISKPFRIQDIKDKIEKWKEQLLEKL
jgi:CheY-like chemotaxis protein